MLLPLRPAWEGKRVAALLVVQSKVAARLPPLSTVWGDAAATCAEMREQVCKLVSQRAIHLGLAELAQPRIQGDQHGARMRGACRAAHSRIPAHLHPRGQSIATEHTEETAGALLQDDGIGWLRR
jgi:hypothetical protein